MGESDSKDDREDQRAIRRVAQVTEHIDPKQSRRAQRRRGTPKVEGLPADHSDIDGQLKTLRKIAANPNPLHRGYAKQKQSGKLWVRERVDKLLDAGSFKEVGSVSGSVKWKQLGGGKEEIEDYVPSNNVQGFGKMGGRDILFTADDFSIRAGK